MTGDPLNSGTLLSASSLAETESDASHGARRLHPFPSRGSCAPRVEPDQRVDFRPWNPDRGTMREGERGMVDSAAKGRLAGKRAIVTGAAMGLGEAIAREFAREGARVVCVDVQAEPNEAVAASIHERGGRPAPLPVTWESPPTWSGSAARRSEPPGSSLAWRWPTDRDRADRPSSASGSRERPP